MFLSGGGVLSKICYAIELPIFFMAGGIQFRYNETEKKTAKNYFAKRICRIIYPYITLSTIYILIELCKMLIKTFIGRQCNIENILGLLKQTCSFWGIGALWFLPTIFFSEFLLYTLCHFRYQTVISVTILLVCWGMNNFMVGLFHAESLRKSEYFLIIGVRILVAYVFEYIGYCIEPAYLQITNKPTAQKENLICIGVIIVGLVLVQFNVGVNMRYGYIGNPIIEYISATVIMMSIVVLLTKIRNKSLMWLSKNSLLIMGMQSLEVDIAFKVKNLPLNVNSNTQMLFICFIVLCVFMLLTIPITEFVNRKVPFILKPVINDNKNERN